jgi:uncharacterized protein YciI
MKQTFLFTSLFIACFFLLASEAWAQPKTMPISETETLYAYTFCMLSKGSSRNQGEAEALKIQEGHMNYLDNLHKKGLLWLAGPFDFETQELPEWRGIVILKTAFEEGLSLMEKDPSVSSGRIALQ